MKEPLMIQTILLDLDNTLILYDETAFFKAYFKMITRYFKELMPENEFLERLLGATRSILQSDGTRTNKDRFMKVFCMETDLEPDRLWNDFIRFYQTEFSRLGQNVRPFTGLDPVMDSLSASGIRLVIATNPVFPEIAQHIRMTWAGLSPDSFALVTHLENTRFCKPAAGYYGDICKEVGCDPSNCLMVGNDPVMDMAAALAGMKTYLVTDSIDAGHTVMKVDRAPVSIDAGKIPQPDFKGPLADLPDAVHRL